MSLLLAALLQSALSPALHDAAERARAAVIAGCHIPGERLAIEQDEGSTLYSVALKGDGPLTDRQVRCFGEKVGTTADVALSIEDQGISARYDRLSQRSFLTTAREILRREGLLGRLPRYDRHRETLAGFAIRLERLCGAAPRSVLRVTGRHMSVRDHKPRATGRGADREFCAINAAIATGHNPLWVPVVPMPQIDPPPLPITDSPVLVPGTE